MTECTAAEKKQQRRVPALNSALTKEAMHSEAMVIERACPDDAHAAAAAAVRGLEDDRVAGLAREDARIGRAQNGALAAGHHRHAALLRQLPRIRLVAHRLYMKGRLLKRSACHQCPVNLDTVHLLVMHGSKSLPKDLLP